MRVFTGVLLAAAISVCLAQEAPPAAEDPVLEKRVLTLSEELRCLVCQNQSLADSNADLAVDLRNQVREMMQQGKSDEQIREFMVARYGDFVLYNPPVKNATLLLWLGPFVLLVAAGAALFSYLRRRDRQLPAQALTEEERARARALLGESREER
ncbi:MAG: cytochrome c-type biogenesis protein CcmH [Betaproteobacteria bacterium]|nr:MAG: cytochrome c-type biogenesis protein CcmH [Betaproteobacteria bacterium]